MMGKREKLRVAGRCEHMARMLWRMASEPDRPWDQVTHLRTAQNIAHVARMLREEATA